MLLTLAPGLRVVPRGHDHLQVGLYDDRRVVLPRSEAVEHVLGQVEQGLPVDLARPGVAAVVTHLVAAGCAFAQWPTRRHRRAGTRIAVLGQVGPDPRPLLTAAGLHLIGRVSGEPERPDVVLILSRGEPDRGRLDPWVRSRTPHLVVRVVDAGVVVGPFVLPGRSACLRCIDAHHADADPDHLPVLARYAEASRRPRGDGSDEPEPALLSLALSWAARDLLAHVDGGRPSTSSRTVRWGPEPDREVHATWSIHPECGCSWSGPAHS